MNQWYLCRKIFEKSLKLNQITLRAWCSAPFNVVIASYLSRRTQSVVNLKFDSIPIAYNKDSLHILSGSNCQSVRFALMCADLWCRRGEPCRSCTQSANAVRRASAMTRPHGALHNASEQVNREISPPDRRLRTAR